MKSPECLALPDTKFLEKRRMFLSKYTTVVIILFFLFVSVSLVFADWQKPQFKFIQSYREDVRGQVGDLFIERLSGTFSYYEDGDLLFEVSPFFEKRFSVYNIENESWVKQKSGIELGTNLLPFFYFSESFQYTCFEDEKDTPEIETSLILSNRLMSLGNKELEWFAFGQHVLDLDEGKGVRNESGLGIIIPVLEFLEAKLNWRHIDRIHGYDSDTVELSFDCVF